MESTFDPFADGSVQPVAPTSDWLIEANREMVMRQNITLNQPEMKQELHIENLNICDDHAEEISNLTTVVSKEMSDDEVVQDSFKSSSTVASLAGDQFQSRTSFSTSVDSSFKSQFSNTFEGQENCDSVWVNFGEQNSSLEVVSCVETKLKKMFEDWQKFSGNDVEKTFDEIESIISTLKGNFKVSEDIICFKKNHSELDEDENEKNSSNQEKLNKEKLSAFQTQLLEAAESILSILRLHLQKDVDKNIIEWGFMSLSDIYTYTCANSMWGILDKQKPLDTVIAIMQAEEDLKIRSSGCYLIARILDAMPDRGSFDTRLVYIANTGAMEIMHATMKAYERNKEIHASCGKGLSLMSVEGRLSSRIIQQNLPQTAIRSLFDHREHVSISGIDHALVNWAFFSQKLYDTYWSQNVSQLIIQRMLKFPDSNHLQRVGCFFILNSWRRALWAEKGKRKMIDELIESESILAIFRALENHVDSEGVNRPALSAIAVMSLCAKRVHKIVLEMGAVDAILKAMAFHENSQKVQRSGCFAIYALASLKTAKTQLKERGAIELVENAKKRFKDNVLVQENASRALARLKNPLVAVKDFINMKINKAIHGSSAEPLLD